MAISIFLSAILRSVFCNGRISSFKGFMKKESKDEILTASKNEASG
jgi:hypothetical protein